MLHVWHHLAVAPRWSSSLYAHKWLLCKHDVMYHLLYPYPLQKKKQASPLTVQLRKAGEETKADVIAKVTSRTPGLTWKWRCKYVETAIDIMHTLRWSRTTDRGSIYVLSVKVFESSWNCLYIAVDWLDKYSVFKLHLWQWKTHSCQCQRRSMRIAIESLPVQQVEEICYSPG